MSDLDLVVPSCLVDPALASDLLRDQAMPNLGRIVARTGIPQSFDLPPHASPTTWQAWVFGTRSDTAIAALNLGELWAMACGIAPSRGRRYIVEPAHFKVANDHLRLDDPRGLEVTLNEARALAAAVEPVLAEAGWRLDPIEPATLTHWMLTRDDDAALSAAAIERAIGDNVAAWQPRGRTHAPDERIGSDAALAWRRCINEIQMLWFGDPVNEAREARGQSTINTLWLSGNGEPRSAMPRYSVVDSSLPLLAALPVEPDATRSLESFDRFVDPVCRDDWSGWREQLTRFDLRLGGVLRQQADGSIGAVTIVLCGRDAAKVLTLGPRDLGKFWRAWLQPGGRTPPLAGLFAEGPIA